MRLWNLNYICVKVIIKYFNSSIISILENDGKILFGLAEGRIIILDQHFTIHNTLAGHKSGIWTLIKMKCVLIASGSADRKIRIWNPKNECKCIKILNANAFIYTLSEINDNLLVSRSADDKSIRLWKHFTPM